MPGRQPDFRYVVKKVTTNAGTASGSPLKTTVNLGDVTLLEVQIVIPDGHAGQTGIAVVSDNFGIVPWDPAISYIVGNNEEPVFEVDMTMGHAIAVWTYNTGAYDHSHYLRFKVRDSALDVNPPGPGVAFLKPIPDATTTAGDASGGDESAGGYNDTQTASDALSADDSGSDDLVGADAP